LDFVRYGEAMLAPTHFRQFGPIPAGFPSPAQGYEDEPLDLHALLVPRPAATFFYRVQGSSLKNQGLPHNAILVVDRSITPRPGQLVVADQDGQRRVCRMPNPCGPKAEAQDLRVWGVVTSAVVRF
jgi:DNA polymerase V